MEQVGRYEIKSRIGAGSFATVFRAHDPLLDVEVAVKLLADNWSANPDVRNRFLTEAKTLRRFSDERIIAVHDIGMTADDRPYFVMDYADAGSLNTLKRQGCPPGLACHLVAEAARGVQALHDGGILHRDVAPGNLLLRHSPDGLRVQIADLGVAKRLVDQHEGTMTAGTPAYMAYEQATGAILDERADVYSLAAVAYALLTGHSPFGIRSLNDILTRDWRVGVVPIAARVGAPQLLDDLMSAALSPDPHYRPRTARELADALDSLAEVLPGGVSVPSQPSQSSERPLAPLPDGFRGSSTSSSHSSVRSETPQEMLDGYLGKGVYEVSQPKERHQPGFYAAIGAGALLLFVFVAIVTVTQFI